MSEESPAKLVNEWRKLITHSPRPPAGLTPTQRLVALVLAQYVDFDTLTTYVGAVRLSGATGHHVSTVKRTLPELVEAGVLEEVSRGGSLAGGSRAANVYRLKFSPTGSTGLPVAGDDRSHSARRPVAPRAPTGSTGRPHLEISRDIKNRRRAKFSTDEYALRCGDCRHESTVTERAEEVFDNPADVIQVVTEWRRLREVEAS